MIAAGLPAPALYHLQRHGRRAGFLPGFEWSHRYPLSVPRTRRSKIPLRSRMANRKPNTKPDAQPEQLDRFGRPLHPGGAAREAAGPDTDGRPAQAEGEGGRGPRRQAAGTPVPEGAKPEDGQRLRRPRPRARWVASRSWAGVASRVKSRKRTRPKAHDTGKAGNRPRKPRRPRERQEATRTSLTPAKRCVRANALGDAPNIRYSAKVDAPKESAGAEAATPRSGSGGDTRACAVGDDRQRNAGARRKPVCASPRGTDACTGGAR